MNQIAISFGDIWLRACCKLPLTFRGALLDLEPPRIRRGLTFPCLQRQHHLYYLRLRLASAVAQLGYALFPLEADCPEA
jgi:hypothetical protein